MKGTIGLEGTFDNALCVPHLIHNLLCVYQLTNEAIRRTAEFTSSSVIIRDLASRDIIATGGVDHAFWLYCLADFAPDEDNYSSANFVHTCNANSHFEENFG